MAARPKPLAHIGTIESIDLPDDAILGVPAKIDTGADYSAIWASDITLGGDRLYFRFFAPGSPYYKTELVETTTFKVIRVKNSFGDVERRYKIKLRVHIGNRKLTRWFTLADRSRNSYPVLLGKNFLKNTFIVDVSRRHVISQSTRANSILILGASQSTAFFEQVGRAMENDTRLVCASYRDLVYHIDGLQSTVVNRADGNTDIARYGVVYFKSHNRAPEHAAAAAEYVRFRGQRFLDPETANYTSMSKLTEYMKLTCGGVTIPVTWSAATDYLVSHYAVIKQALGSPFVLKEIRSNRGRNNYLIARETDFRTVLAAAEPTQSYVAQQFVKNDGFFRLYIMGSGVSLAVWRAATPHRNPLKAHLNKPSGGANATLVAIKDIPPEAVALASQAARCMDRKVAGVDIVQGKQTGEWYVLEVNNAPQLRGGSFVAEKAKAVAELLDEELNR